MMCGDDDDDDGDGGDIADIIRSAGIFKVVSLKIWRVN